MLDETEIYLTMKKWLKDNEWTILGGEPPGGTNDIPIVELRDIDYTKKGSKGSKKIDLVAFKKGYFLLLELKPTYSYSDVTKLNEIVREAKWRKAFLLALREKRVLNEIKDELFSEERYVNESSYYVKAVGFNYTGRFGPRDFVTFLVSKDHVEVSFGSNVPTEVRRLMS